jgi:hypothetical protein
MKMSRKELVGDPRLLLLVESKIEVFEHVVQFRLELQSWLRIKTSDSLSKVRMSGVVCNFTIHSREKVVI